MSVTIPSLDPVTDILDTDKIMVTQSSGQTYTIDGASFNKRNQAVIANSTTLTGAPLKTGNIVRAYFTADITGVNTTTGLVLNYNGSNKNVKVPKDGALANFTAQNMGGSPTVYKYLQAYTTLELLYDGTNFVIIGNPVVISSADYTIYADGSITFIDKVKYKDGRSADIDELDINDNSYSYEQLYAALTSSGTPPDGVSSAIIKTYKWDTGNYALQISNEINTDFRIHVRYYTGSAWQNWNELWQIKSKEINVGNVTISNLNYTAIYTTQDPIEIIAVKLTDWSNNTDAFSIIPYGNNNIYLIAKQGFSITRLKIKIYYRTTNS